MYTFDTYVPASRIWPTANDYIDFGYRAGLLRGYNIEVKTKDGKLDWLSCSYIHEDPIDKFNDDFHQWYFTEHNWTPTGRICFRGYGREVYDEQWRESFIIPVEVSV